MAFSAQTAATSTNAPGATAALASFVCTAQVGDPAMRRAISVLLDTMAATLAGGAEPPVRRLAATLESMPDGVPSFWSARPYRADDAALLIGMAAHVLDYDDVSMLTVCHPTAPVLSAALLPLGLGERRTPLAGRCWTPWWPSAPR